MQIGNINQTTPLSGGTTGAARISGGGDGFGSAIKDAVESIDETQKSAGKRDLKSSDRRIARLTQNDHRPANRRS